MVSYVLMESVGFALGRTDGFGNSVSTQSF